MDESLMVDDWSSGAVLGRDGNTPFVRQSCKGSRFQDRDADETNDAMRTRMKLLTVKNGPYYMTA